MNRRYINKRYVRWRNWTYQGTLARETWTKGRLGVGVGWTRETRTKGRDEQENFKLKIARVGQEEFALLILRTLHLLVYTYINQILLIEYMPIGSAVVHWTKEQEQDLGRSREQEWD